eukprot:TRINITY_DN67963_c12_g6_i1.p1 TRINITY_DN67963_c12_g6~~TRINITY_DN67963_c12_g6_i1.p1  ORF type:complete len:609 (-),score=39.35 TRINITY_DN67963_c12_g6_i1:146-1894(-)
MSRVLVKDPAWFPDDVEPGRYCKRKLYYFPPKPTGQPSASVRSRPPLLDADGHFATVFHPAWVEQRHEAAAQQTHADLVKTVMREQHELNLKGSLVCPNSEVEKSWGSAASGKLNVMFVCTYRKDADGCQFLQHLRTLRAEEAGLPVVPVLVVRKDCVEDYKKWFPEFPLLVLPKPTTHTIGFAREVALQFAFENKLGPVLMADDNILSFEKSKAVFDKTKDKRSSDPLNFREFYTEFMRWWECCNLKQVALLGTTNGVERGRSYAKNKEGLIPSVPKVFTLINTGLLHNKGIHYDSRLRAFEDMALAGACHKAGLLTLRCTHIAWRKNFNSKRTDGCGDVRSEIEVNPYINALPAVHKLEDLWPDLKLVMAAVRQEGLVRLPKATTVAEMKGVLTVYLPILHDVKSNRPIQVEHVEKLTKKGLHSQLKNHRRKKNASVPALQCQLRQMLAPEVRDTDEPLRPAEVVHPEHHQQPSEDALCSVRRELEQVVAQLPTTVKLPDGYNQCDLAGTIAVHDWAKRVLMIIQCDPTTMTVVQLKETLSWLRCQGPRCFRPPRGYSTATRKAELVQVLRNVIKGGQPQ